ncbi:cytochrome c family protein [Agrobacterium tumefaciens]|uniref:c-type cytochrome n=1 Tax=Agrobacterium tumefaciens TaxID=358 RepID=UPI00157330C8|nr:cytochrome c family protein [Agrobacterium tumefaciens]NSY99661.1 cytochrome c family protein [Agrobacterium tumefaciens]NSZ36414.1 cytochrome c family protein [Agrobacterium tumefaciens]NTB21930.1 cytochrome c family protein [Agrobacterium tumefaciens]NTB31724.1 cytochrome c family protein [Agrobacterium tumefaciens]NTB32205.1 cytochrome c family protein [Agrobacterium tumefaciens]
MLNALRLIMLIATICIADLAAASDLGDPTRGQQLFRRCSSCHSIQTENKSGPPLNGVVGRDAAVVEGYHYSTALSNSGLNWTEDALDNYLAGPTKLVRGTRMTVSVAREQDRADIIAYLKSLGGQ